MYIFSPIPVSARIDYSCCPVDILLLQRKSFGRYKKRKRRVNINKTKTMKAKPFVHVVGNKTQHH